MKGKDIINSFCIPFTQHNSEEGKKLSFLMDEKGGIIVKIGFFVVFHSCENREICWIWTIVPFGDVS